MELKNSKKEKKQIAKIVKKIMGFNYNWKDVERWAEVTMRYKEDEINLMSKDKQHLLYIKLDNDMVVDVKHLPLSSRVLLWEKGGK